MEKELKNVSLTSNGGCLPPCPLPSRTGGRVGLQEDGRGGKPALVVVKTVLRGNKKIVPNNPDSGPSFLAAMGTPAPHNLPVHH